MSEASNRAIRGSVRALAGVLIIGVAASLAVLIGATTLPTIERDPVALTVDARHGAERPFVCSGSFAELGADPSRPGVAIPAGTAIVATSGKLSQSSELERAESGGSAPEVERVPAGVSFAAAQSQQVVTDDLRGLVASSCAEPMNEQWLVGGATTVGVSTTVNIGNPAEVPATVQMTVYDENGQVDSAQTSGVLVPAGSERIVSLNGYAPGRELLAVKVDSTGAAVTATLGIGHVSGLQPVAVDTVTRQIAPRTTLVVAGVTNIGNDHHGAGDAGKLDQYPVVVRALSSTGEPGTATIRALLGDGSSEELGSITLSGEAVNEKIVDHWPENANAVVIESTVPIVAGVLAQASGDGAHDYAWFAPTPELSPNTEIAVAVVDNGQLVLANPGPTESRVVLSSFGVADQEYIVPAGASIAVRAPADSRLTSSTPIYAAVRVATSEDIAGYPVLAEPERASEITVFPR